MLIISNKSIMAAYQEYHTREHSKSHGHCKPAALTDISEVKGNT